MAESGEFSPEELHSALFAQLVMQQSNLALMLLGKAPHPETGKTVRDLDSARLFIDQLEMLEAKTKGNLNAHEAALLKQSLMSLRMAFVEAVNAPEAGEKPAEKLAEKKETPPAEQPAPSPETKSSPSAAGEDEGKRFSKKYSL